MTKEDILVIQLPFLMKKEVMAREYDRILKQMESGLVLLPGDYKLTLCQKDVEVRFVGSNNDIFEDRGEETIMTTNISEDGTLTVNVEDGNKVSRVLVCGDNHFGGLYYPEQEVSTEKTGRWFVDEGPESNREIICSNCEQPIFKYHKMDFDYRPRFCPNCGAKMGVEE